jgi:hypothetical protein
LFHSRDARRRHDVSVIVGGVTQYESTRGTTFIRYNGLACSLPSEDNAALPGTGPGCVGASGRAYGKMNLKAATNSAPGYASNPPRTYATDHTIGEALLQGGFLTNMPQDPNAKANVFNDPNAPDYVLIRACIITGHQQVGTRGTVFGVWAPLEGSTTADEDSNNDRYPGGKKAGPETDPNNTNGDPYIYDFAAQWNEWATGAYYLHGVAGGNGVTKVTAKNDCASGPVTS